MSQTGYSALLITVEDGTGQDVVAQLCHYYSSRRGKLMLTINCRAIPSDLVENELFGHGKGAFTGAHALKEGSFKLADVGTLLLDEIGYMPKAIQIKLLCAVKPGSFRRVGSRLSNSIYLPCFT